MVGVSTASLLAQDILLLTAACQKASDAYIVDTSASALQSSAKQSAVHVGPKAATTETNSEVISVELDMPDLLHVDEDPVFWSSSFSSVMTAALDANAKILPTGCFQTNGDAGFILRRQNTERTGCRAHVPASVELIVALIARTLGLSAEVGRQ